MSDELEMMRQRIAELEAENEHARFRCGVAALLVRLAARQIDEMFPNDEHPDMQRDLREVANSLQIVAGDEMVELAKARIEDAVMLEKQQHWSALWWRWNRR